MIWRIEVSEAAEKQLGKLDKPVAARIRSFIHERVAILDDPRSIGEALKGSALGEFWRYRVGDWRIICKIHDTKILIVILGLGNRQTRCILKAVTISALLHATFSRAEISQFDLSQRCWPPRI